MDHLPNPQNPYRPVEIPYLGGCEYDNLGFEGYPERMGWTIRQLYELLRSPDRNVGGKDSNDALALSQSWLFFGTLGQVFDTNGIIIHRDKFVRRRDEEGEMGATFITTESLPSLAVEYLEIEKCLPDAIRLQHRHYIHDRLHATYDEAKKFENITAENRGKESSIFFSVAVLCTSLSSLLYGEYFSMKINGFLSGLMLREGWCPNQVAMICDVFFEACGYYIYLLGPSMVEKDHRHCSRNICAANQIDQGTYETKHLRGDCMCGWIEPRLQKIISISEASGIPLISLPPPTDETNLDCDVEEFTPGISYLAISHVWSDGLGNPRKNALPLCQMKALRSRAWALLPVEERHPGRKLYIWIDTLCVPLMPDSARSAAIATMQRTYTEATWVLVLDAELMRRSQPSSQLETRMRIVTSVWFSRLWTFQEGVLARSLHFQFKNEVASGQQLYEAEKRTEDEKVALGVSTKHLVWSYPRSTILGQRVFNTKEQKLNLLQGLQWRSTTKMRDEAICIAVLLDIDVRWLMTFPEEDRFRAMLEARCHFRLGMLFYNGPRMANYGYRWAPRSFMTHGDPISLGHVSAYFTSYGTNAAGLCFESIGLSLGAVHIVANATRFTLTLPWEDSYQSLYVLCCADSSSSFLEELYDLKTLAELALIPSGLILGQITQETMPAVGVLVSTVRKTEFIWFARFICLVLMTRFTAGFERLEWQDTKGNRTKVVDIGKAALIPYRAWCVG